MIRNTVEFEIEGRKIGFRTGTMAIAVAVKEAGCSSTEDLFLKLSEANLIATNALFYGSAYQWHQWKNLPIDFNATHVSEWIEDIGEEKASTLTDKLLESYIPKNLRPPQETGENQA